MDPRSIPVRFSRLKSMGRSPMHYRHAIDSDHVDSASMRLGRLVHWRLLGGLPDDEDGAIVVYDGERRGKAWTEFEAANAGKDIVTTKEYEKSEPIAAAVLADPVAPRFMAGRHEVPVAWKLGDRACSSRLDVLGELRDVGPFLCDLKTTTDASPEAFKRQAWKMAYHAQLAFYADALKSTGIETKAHYLVAVETKAPHAVTVLRLTDNILNEGRRLYRSWFERLMVCESDDNWPSYSQHCVEFDVPAWIEVGADDDDGEEEAAA